MGELIYTAPAPLNPSHRIDGFACEEPSLESWLKRRARKNHDLGASRVFVVTADGDDVVGYYALSAGSVSRAISPGRLRRNMPEPIPVAVLGRLAVHTAHTGKGLGSGLLKDAVLRTQRLADELGIRALLCHALDDRTLRFYQQHGFLISPIEPLTALLPITTRQVV